MNQTTPNTPIDIIQFARLVLDAIESAGCDYMLAGSFALAAWAEARSTQDVDIVVHLPVEAIVKFSDELKRRDMLVPADILLDAVIEGRGDISINAIHLYGGYKAEFFLLQPNDEYHQVAFNRRQIVEMWQPLGKVSVQAPEDLILNKMLYYAIRQQSKHTRDIQSILLAMPGELDLTYISTWAARLGLAELWRTLHP